MRQQSGVFFTDVMFIFFHIEHDANLDLIKYTGVYYIAAELGCIFIGRLARTSNKFRP